MSQSEILSRSTSVSRKLKENVWVTITNSSSDDIAKSTIEDCNHSCLMDGLNYAQMLGESAKKGFDVVFLEDSLRTSENAFKLAVTTLHKKLIGNGVFATRIVKSTPDGKLSNLFAYCSRKTSGALTLVGINFSNMRTKFNVRLSTIIDPNISIIQYQLSAQNGQVLLNNEKFLNNLLSSSVKYKKLSKFSIPMALPPFSLAFWTLKNVKVDECNKLTNHPASNNEDIQLSTFSSSDKLLLSLVANEMQNTKNQVTKFTRMKRQTAEQFLPSSTFEFPNFKLPNLLMTSSSNNKPIVENFFRNADILRNPFSDNVNNDENPFRHSENPTLPKGDVYMDIGKAGEQPQVDSLDYVVFNEPKKAQNIRKKMRAMTTTTESSDYFALDYADVILRKSAKKSSSKSSRFENLEKNSRREMGELFELDEIQAAADDGEFKNDDDQQQQRSKSKINNVELSTVIKELEPTYLQSRRALKQAKKKWDKNQIMELLKNSQVQEIDRKNIKNFENYEIIDLAELKRDDEDYAEYDNDEDDDEFFGNAKGNVQQQRQSKRGKRQIDVARINNKIPKIKFNEITDSSSDEADYSSNENLNLDTNDVVHMFVQTPRPDGKANVWDGTSNVKIRNSNNEDDSTVVKAVNFFTHSFNKALDVLDQTIVGCWEIFRPKEFKY